MGNYAIKNNRKFDLRILEEINESLVNYHLSYKISGRNKEGRIWARVDYIPDKNKVIERNFTITELTCNMDGNSAHFTLTPTRNGALNLEIVTAKRETDIEGELKESLEKLFLTTN